MYVLGRPCRRRGRAARAEPVPAGAAHADGGQGQQDARGGESDLEARLGQGGVRAEKAGPEVDDEGQHHRRRHDPPAPRRGLGVVTPGHPGTPPLGRGRDGQRKERQHPIGVDHGERAGHRPRGQADGEDAVDGGERGLPHDQREDGEPRRQRPLLQGEDPEPRRRGFAQGDGHEVEDEEGGDHRRRRPLQDRGTEAPGPERPVRADEHGDGHQHAEGVVRGVPESEQGGAVGPGQAVQEEGRLRRHLHPRRPRQEAPEGPFRAEGGAGRAGGGHERRQGRQEQVQMVEDEASRRGFGRGKDGGRRHEEGQVEGAGGERAADAFRHWTRRLYHLVHGRAPSHRPPRRHPAQRLGAPLRRGHRRRPHLLLAAGDRTGGGHSRPARLDRPPDLRGRPSHGLSARPLRVRAGEREPAARLGLPPFPSVLQLRAVQPEVRAARRGRRLRAPRAERRRPRGVRGGAGRGLGGLSHAVRDPQGGHAPHPLRDPVPDPERLREAAEEGRARVGEESHRAGALRDPGGRLHLDGAHAVRDRPPPPAPDDADGRRARRRPFPWSRPWSTASTRSIPRSSRRSESRRTTAGQVVEGRWPELQSDGDAQAARLDAQLGGAHFPSRRLHGAGARRRRRRR